MLWSDSFGVVFNLVVLSNGFFCFKFGRLKKIKINID